MRAPPTPPVSPVRRGVLPVVGPIADAAEARMLESMVLICEMRDRLSPSSPRRR